MTTPPPPPLDRQTNFKFTRRLVRPAALLLLTGLAVMAVNATQRRALEMAVRELDPTQSRSAFTACWNGSTFTGQVKTLHRDFLTLRIRGAQFDSATPTIRTVTVTIPRSELRPGTCPSAAQLPFPVAGLRPQHPISAVPRPGVSP